MSVIYAYNKFFDMENWAGASVLGGFEQRDRKSVV